MDPVEGKRSRVIKRVFFGVIIVFGVLVALGSVFDGMDRWTSVHGSGTLGTLRLERIVTTSVGRPPSIEQWGGTFRSDDGRVETFAVLEEPLPGGDSAGAPGQEFRVRQSISDRGQVFLASDSKAFRNWVEGEFFLVVAFGLVGAVLLWVRARKRRAQAGP